MHIGVFWVSPRCVSLLFPLFINHVFCVYTGGGHKFLRMPALRCKHDVPCWLEFFSHMSMMDGVDDCPALPPGVQCIRIALVFQLPPVATAVYTSLNHTNYSPKTATQET